MENQQTTTFTFTTYYQSQRRMLTKD